MTVLRVISVRVLSTCLCAHVVIALVTIVIVDGYDTDDVIFTVVVIVV